MRLVVCDDHRMFTDALVGLLEARGHQAYVCHDPTAVHEIATAVSPDACLLDYRFGDDPVSEACVRAICAACPSAVVLVLTATPDRTVVMQARAWGAHGVIGKTRGVDDLLTAICAARFGRFIDDSCPSVLPDGLAAHARLVMSSLAPREREVLACLASGMRATAIAEVLGISDATARSHIQRVLTKLGVHSRVAAVAFAAEHGLV